MAKILVGMNEGKFPEVALRIIQDLLGNAFAHLIQGIKLKDGEHVPVETSKNGKAARKAATAAPHVAMMLSMNVQPEQGEDTTEEAFSCHCEQMTLSELSNKSIFADLMILTYEGFIKEGQEEEGRKLLTDTIRHSKCPVLLLPENVSCFDQFILTYDGKESSVFAIKTFSLLFGNVVKQRPASIFTVVPYDEQEIKNERALLDLVQQHFEDVGLQVLQGDDIADEILRFSRCSDSPVIIMGAFGRSTVSNLLMPSVAGQLIEKNPMPLFIAHH
jgi:nucleotide-binding universal stress UspA family protein